jgi:hypothetical protein
MTKPQKRVLFVAVTAITIAALVWIEFDTHLIGRWFASTIYDNHANFLDCAELPSLSAVEQVVSEPQDLIQQIMDIRPDFINVTIDQSCPGKGILVIEYASHADRIQIEELIGDTFLGISWKGINT